MCSARSVRIIPVSTHRPLVWVVVADAIIIIRARQRDAADRAKSSDPGTSGGIWAVTRRRAPPRTERRMPPRHRERTNDNVMGPRYLWRHFILRVYYYYDGAAFQYDSNASDANVLVSVRAGISRAVRRYNIYTTNFNEIFRLTNYSITNLFS